MIRTQIQLTEEQAKKLKALAAKKRVSMAELIRRSIDQYLRSSGPVVSDEERRRRAIAVVGRFRGGPPDLSVEHDRYLDEIYGDWKRRGDTND